MSESLTINQAAARLGISERTVRKRIKAGEIKADKEPRESGGTVWHVWLDAEAVGSAPEVSNREPEARRKENELNGSAPEVVTEDFQARAGNVPTASDRQPDAAHVAHLESEVLFLRSLIEQRDRDAAELRAALRKALEVMPKALTSGEQLGQVGTEKKVRENASQEPIITTGDQTSETSAKQEKTRIPARKLTAWQRAAARILGIR